MVSDVIPKVKSDNPDEELILQVPFITILRKTFVLATIMGK